MMKYMLNMTRGNLLYELSAEDIESCIKEQRPFWEIRLTEYLYDEAGDVCGLKGLADLGHGYGFDNGRNEFEIRAGEIYSFVHEGTSADGPSDWSDNSFRVTLKLVRRAG